MKKVCFVLGFAIAISSSLFAADIKSENIVGFHKISTPPGKFVLISVNFAAISGKDKISLQEFFKHEDLTAANDSNDYYDQVFVTQGTNYISFYFGHSAIDGASMWLDEKGEPAEKTFSRGESFWFKRAENSKKTTLTLAGEIPVQGVVTTNALPDVFLAQ